MNPIRAARTVSLVAVVGAPLSSALGDSRVRWNQPALAIGRGAVGDQPWG